MPCECVYCASESREGNRLTHSRVEVVGIGKVTRPDTLWMFNRQSIDSFWYCSIATLHYELKVKGVGRDCETFRMHAWPDGIWICKRVVSPFDWDVTPFHGTGHWNRNTKKHSLDQPLQNMKPGTREERCSCTQLPRPAVRCTDPLADECYRSIRLACRIDQTTVGECRANASVCSHAATQFS
jgi:hypothetical protein